MAASVAVVSMWIVPAAQAAGAPRVAVFASVDSARQDSALRELRAEILRSLRDAGIEVVPPDALAAAGCRDVDWCRARLDRVGASHAIEIKARYQAETFALTLTLWNAKDTEPVARESRDCPICDLNDFYTAGRELAAALADRLWAVGDQIQIAAQAQDTPTPDPTLGIGTPSAVPRVQKPWWPWVAVGSAAAMATVGTVVLWNDGEEVNCRAGICRTSRETTMAGWAWIGTAAVVGGVGVWGLISGSGESNDNVVLSVTPLGAALGGRF